MVIISKHLSFHVFSIEIYFFPFIVEKTLRITVNNKLATNIIDRNSAPTEQIEHKYLKIISLNVNE